MLVETALAMPIFMLMLFGIIEFSGVLMSFQGGTNTVQSGARLESASGNDAFSDRDALLRMKKEAAGIPGGEIQQIIIWKATGPGDTPPAACKSATDGVSGVCNVYNNPETAVTGAFALAADPLNSHYFGSTSTPADAYTATRLDRFWAPTSRLVVTAQPGTASTKQTDFVGVYIKIRHAYYTGMFGSAITVTDQSIARIEPQEYSST